MGIRALLQERKSSKQEILRAGTEQALSHSEEDLHRIDRALERLRIGSYGACIKCGGDIPKQRLKIIPEAERCTSCQKIFEEGRH